MKAPNKIYLGIEELDSGYVYNSSLDNNGHPEYIRKDALLEWALAEKKKLDNIEDKDDVQMGGLFCIEAVIKKLNSM